MGRRSDYQDTGLIVHNIVIGKKGKGKLAFFLNSTATS